MNNENNNLQHFNAELAAPVKNKKPVVPYADIFSSVSGYHINLDMPGVTKEKFNLKVENGELVVKGELEPLTEKESEYYYNEIDHTGYERTFVLPNEIDPDKIEATYADGVLKLTLNKKEELKPKLIEIK